MAHRSVRLSDFKDYRRAVQTYTYESLTNGDHVLTVAVTDLPGKTLPHLLTLKKFLPINLCSKVKRYICLLMAIIWNLLELSTLLRLVLPAFNDAGKHGKSYAGAADGYLTFQQRE